jgi:hypothetical protein
MLKKQDYKIIKNANTPDASGVFAFFCYRPMYIMIIRIAAITAIFPSRSEFNSMNKELFKFKIPSSSKT